MMIFLSLTGCVTKSKANAQARASFLAGRQQAMTTQMQGPLVQFVGDVKNHVVSWNEGLTLIHALLAAEYLGPGDPSQISLVREGQSTTINLQLLLRGQDVDLLPGDRIEIRP